MYCLLPLLRGRQFGAIVAEPSDSGGVAMVIACYVERLLTESEPNLCWPSTSLALVAPFV